MLALPTTSSGERGTHSSEWEGTPTLRRERHAHGRPSRWGEQCWLYQQRALGSGKLIPQNEGTFRRSEGSGIFIGNPLKVRGVMLALPTASSEERRTHSSEWEGTQTLRRERHAHSRRAKRGGPSLTHRPHPTANFIRLRASAAVGPESREADSCPSFLEKRDRTRAELLHRKSSQCTQISPQGHRVRAPCPNKRSKDCVCHWVSNNEDADPCSPW